MCCLRDGVGALCVYVCVCVYVCGPLAVTYCSPRGIRKYRMEKRRKKRRDERREMRREQRGKERR